jgi:hypothetical protein
MECTVKPNSQVKLMGSTEKKDGLELLKGWITELLVTFVYTMVFSFI